MFRNTTVVMASLCQDSMLSSILGVNTKVQYRKRLRPYLFIRNLTNVILNMLVLRHVYFCGIK